MIVGSDQIYSIENFYVKYLREAGVEVNQFIAQRYFYDYYQKSILNKLVYRIGISSILYKINRLFKKEVEKFRPDIIWVFKGMELSSSSLVWAKSKGIKLVNFNGDSPFLFSGKGSGNANVTKAIGLYDLHFTYNVAVQKELQERFKAKTVILPFGFDIDEHVYKACTSQNEMFKVCFLGNPDKDRGRFIQGLAESGIQIDLFGNDWNKYVHHKNATLSQPVYELDAWKILRKYRVQLNLMRPHNPDTHNMRTFELGGIGAIQLAPDTPDHKQYFKRDKEIFLFSDLETCVHQIKYLLGLSQEEAHQIRANSRNRSIDSGYSYKDRSREALEHLRILIA